MAMLRALQKFNLTNSSVGFQAIRAMSKDSAGRMGSGAGKGGGAGGSIRSAGGAFGEIEAAREEEYFRKLQAQQLKVLHDHLEDEVRHQESEINRMQDELKRRQMKLDQLKTTVSEQKKKSE